VGLWALTFTERPADHRRITPAELAVLPASGVARRTVPWRALFRRMMPVTVVYFCYGWTLWLFLSWLPQYFLRSHALDLKRSALFASGVFLAGVFGDMLGGIVTDSVYRRTGSLRQARSAMVAACLLLSLLSLVPLLLTHELNVCLACLCSGFFFAEMTIGPMWAIPMDIAPEFSGTASGMMNAGSALAAIISPVISGMLIDRYDNWDLPFIASMILMALGILLAFGMRPENRFHSDVASRALVTEPLPTNEKAPT
jgi:MFS family permease